MKNQTKAGRWRPVGLAARLLAAALLAAGCDVHRTPDLSAGVSLTLAEHRAGTISDVRYALRFSIPDDPDARVRGSARIRFRLADARTALVLDFTGGEPDVIAVRVGGEPADWDAASGHLVVPARSLVPGENEVEVEFLAGDDALNRSRTHLYTLFVPDRASTAFPAFDQPDLKARYTLELEVPAGWATVANGPATAETRVGDRKRIRFAETEPISTYLFAFAAGELSVEEREANGRPMRMLHRETDGEKLARNRDAVFDLHDQALRWLEAYTGIEYAFGKFDFVALPSFQFGGMEHPGAVWYRGSSLLLEETATQAQVLGRASLIAHETAHMWFGNLVTMRWFDDVWMKEVFANFMAAKIVNPAFPEVDHDLRFLLAHHPAAYRIDRTAGTHPIRQPLDNLNDAASLYGPIIYQKAPVVMRQLEELAGADVFREGVREYLREFAFANASWADLIAILDRLVEIDLRAWSRVWVEEAGRPTIRARIVPAENGRIGSLVVEQRDPENRGRVWPQRLHVLLGYPDRAVPLPIRLDSARVTVPEAAGLPLPDYVLPGAAGLGYGKFVLDPESRFALLRDPGAVADDVARGAALLVLWDALLEAEIPPDALVRALARLLETEREEQLVQHAIGRLTTTFWRFLDPAARERWAPVLEALLWDRMEAAGAPRQKAAFFNGYRDIAATPAAVARLERIWRRDEDVAGLPLAEEDDVALALELAVRDVAGADSILVAQLRRIENPDRRERFAFIAPALSPDAAVRDSFFDALREPANRRREPWVLDGLRYLNHPLRAEQSEKHILPALGLLEEIQRTGDIFFPARWLDAALGGHSTPAAASTVRDFLDARPDLPPRLRQKVLQSADLLFRAADHRGDSRPRR